MKVGFCSWTNDFPASCQAMHPGLETHFSLTILEWSPFDLAESCLRLSGAPLPASPRTGAQFRALVPNALAAPDTLVDVNRAAVPGVEERVDEAGVPGTMRTATPTIVGEGFVREFPDFHHGLPPLRPPARSLGCAA